MLFPSPAFSLTNWESLHGITLGVSLKVPQVKQLLQDLGVSHLLLDDDKRCDWTATPYSSVNSKGWADGKHYGQSISKIKTTVTANKNFCIRYIYSCMKIILY